MGRLNLDKAQRLFNILYCGNYQPVYTHPLVVGWNSNGVTIDSTLTFSTGGQWYRQYKVTAELNIPSANFPGFPEILAWGQPHGYSTYSTTALMGYYPNTSGWHANRILLAELGVTQADLNPTDWTRTSYTLTGYNFSRIYYEGGPPRVEYFVRPADFRMVATYVSTTSAAAVDDRGAETEEADRNRPCLRESAQNTERDSARRE